MPPPPPRSTLFPYTTLFRSSEARGRSRRRRKRPRAKPQESRSEEHTSELQSRVDIVCRLLLEKKKKTKWCGEGFNRLESKTSTRSPARFHVCLMTYRYWPEPNAVLSLFFFFTGAATTDIYTLSLHDALPI